MLFEFTSNCWALYVCAPKAPFCVQNRKGSHAFKLLFPENWVHFLVGVEPIATTKPKSRERKDLLLAANKENTGDLCQSRVSPNSKIEDVLS